MKLLSSGRIVADNITVSGETVLIGDKPVQSDRPARMELPGADADLRAEAIPVSVRKSCAAVPVHAGAVHHLLEIRRRLRVLRENGVRVMRSVSVDMIHRLLNSVDKADGDVKVIVFSRELLRLHDVVRLQHSGDEVPVRRAGSALQRSSEQGLRLLRAMDGHACCRQLRYDAREKRSGNPAVNQQRLHRIAGGGVLSLGIQDDRNRPVLIRLPVHINMADTARMTHHRNLGVIHDIADKLSRSSRNQEVHTVVTGKKLVNFTVCLRLKERRFRKSRLHCRLMNEPEEHAVRSRRLLPALQNRTVSALDAQRCHLNHCIRPRLENHADHADRNRHLRQNKSFVQLPSEQNFAHRIRQLYEFPESGRTVTHFAVVIAQTLSHCLRDTGALRRREILRVRGENIFPVLPECSRHPFQRPVPRLHRRGRHLRRRLLHPHHFIPNIHRYTPCLRESFLRYHPTSG